jgi:hypothetical protein
MLLPLCDVIFLSTLDLLSSATQNYGHVYIPADKQYVTCWTSTAGIENSEA